jgi:butyrate kinase
MEGVLNPGDASTYLQVKTLEIENQTLKHELLELHKLNNTL